MELRAKIKNNFNNNSNINKPRDENRKTTTPRQVYTKTEHEEPELSKPEITKEVIVTKSRKTESKPNIHKDHRARLKKQFIENGIDKLTDVQKLELLLFYALPQKDTNPLSHNLINEFGSLSEVLSASFNELTKVDGVKENTATLIKFFGSMLNYCGRPVEDDIINNSAKAKAYATKYFNHIAVEQFYMFCLTKSNKVKKAFLINSGSTSEVNVEIRNVTEKALETNCNRIIVAHNHPHGRAVMSGQDCRFTYSLLCSCILNNIDLLDHIIVGTDRSVSLYEQGIISKLKKKAAYTIQITDYNKMFVSEKPEGYEKSEVDNSFDDSVDIDSLKI